MRQTIVSAALGIIVAALVAADADAQRLRRNLSDTRAEMKLLSAARLEVLTAALKADHFLVNPGRLYGPDVLGLACDGTIVSCNGNNAANPYMVASLPPVGYVYNEDPPMGFFMRPDEAVVLVGRTPPPLAYFSYRSFTFNRVMEKEGGLRRKFFNSLGDPNNMLTLNTRGKALGDPYDRAYVLVIVADQGTKERVARALDVAGYPDQIINFDVPSPQLARLGIDTMKDDELLFINRFALWERGYEQAGAEYLANPPVSVLRVTPDGPVDPAALRPLPTERLRPRGTGRTEMDLTPELDALRDAILAAHQGFHADELRPGVWLEESFDAAQRGIDTLGESRDTVYLRAEGTVTLAEDEFLIVYGVNHEATGKATYASFTVYDACKACGVEGENSRRLAGSALDYVGAENPDVPHVDSFYTWKVARNCGADPRCTTVETGPCPGKTALETPLFIGFRAYVEPQTKIGPAFTEVLFDRVIKFSPSGPALSQTTVTPWLVTTSGTPATISFHVTSADGLDVHWTATLLPDDGCATLDPASGTVAGGIGDVSLTITPPEGQMSRMVVVLNATDSKGRRAAPRTVQANWYWQP